MISLAWRFVMTDAFGADKEPTGKRKRRVLQASEPGRGD
jgi:hypothetical protein